MATVEELRDSLAQLIVTVNMMVTNISAAVAATAPPGVRAAAAPPVVLNVEQRINSSSDKLVQLSRQDSQYTDKEKGQRVNPAYDITVPGSQPHLRLLPDPTSQITSNRRVVKTCLKQQIRESNKARCTD